MYRMKSYFILNHIVHFIHIQIDKLHELLIYLLKIINNF